MRILSIRVLLFALLVLTLSTAAFAQIRISVTHGPPALFIYEQPICQSGGYVWIRAFQTEHVQAARGQPELRTSTNHGMPLIAATPRPVEFRDRAAFPARD
jgi:hypothetical protein